MILKIVLKAGFDMYTRKGGTEILMRLSELVVVFKEARRDKNFFSLGSLKIYLKNIWACSEILDLQKNIHLVTNPFNIFYTSVVIREPGCPLSFFFTAFRTFSYLSQKLEIISLIFFINYLQLRVL